MGRTTVLVFYPFAFSPVCTDQLNLYDELRDEFASQGATLYGVSCDAVWSQSAFKEKLGVEIEQLSDFEPKGAVCKAFDVYHPGGFPQRALVVIGPDTHREVELPGRLAGRPPRREPDLRRPRKPPEPSRSRRAACAGDERSSSAPVPAVSDEDHVRGPRAHRC